MNKPSKGYQGMGHLQHVGLVVVGGGGGVGGVHNRGVWGKDQKFSNSL